jgi:hypothetical protein
VLGLLHFFCLADLYLTPELLMPIFLPALIFETAYHVECSRFRRYAWPILLFAVVGVLVAVAVAAGQSWALLRAAAAPGWGLKHSLLRRLSAQEGSRLYSDHAASQANNQILPPPTYAPPSGPDFPWNKCSYSPPPSGPPHRLRILV